ncbi:uncharacterized protein [Ambystoma mexicanum]|uniref:uncharacterized protein isoform X1 n=1 Tax=Ambystoma mexicanum TaxID=8296 RepID=UPI0037E7ACBA
MVVLDFLTFLMYHRMATGAPTAYTVLYSRHSCCEEARRRGPLCRCPLLRTTGPSRSCEKTGQRNPDIGPREPVEKYPARGWRVSRRGPDEGRWRAAWRGARSRAALHRENLLERTRGGSSGNQQEGANTELEKENLCKLAKGDHVLLRNFNRKWNDKRFTGPHLVEDVSTRAVKLKDKRAWNHLHDVKIYKLQTRPSANDRSIGRTATTSSTAEGSSTTDNDPIVPIPCHYPASPETITDEERGDPHTAHPMVTRSRSKNTTAN